MHFYLYISDVFYLKFVYSTKNRYFVELTKLDYMKKLIFILGIFLHTIFCLPMQAETAAIDSLKRELQVAKRQNTSKEKLIELYQTLGAEYETQNHDSSYYYIQKGLSLYSKPTFEEEGYLQLLNSLANYLFMEGKIEQAKEKFKTVATPSQRKKIRSGGCGRIFHWCLLP